MNAKKLIGKKALRETPVEKQENSQTYMYGPSVVTVSDYRYCTEAVVIIAASDHHIVVEQKRTWKFKKEDPDTEQVILDERYCDDNWVSYDELLPSGK